MILELLHRYYYSKVTSMKCSLKTISLTQELRGLSEGYAAVAHKSGTCGIQKCAVIVSTSRANECSRTEWSACVCRLYNNNDIIYVAD